MVISSEPVDEELSDAYDLIQKRLLESPDAEDFMDCITTSLLISPELMRFDNILYIIDDRYSRPKCLKGISGRILLQQELDNLGTFLEYPKTAIVEFFSQKFDWQLDDDEHSDLLTNFCTLIHIYQGCFWLRQYIYECTHMLKSFKGGHMTGGMFRGGTIPCIGQ